MQKRVSIHGQWSSKLIFILAATGSAVGLGNIWKFPYMAGDNGGAAFVLVYLLAIAMVGLPIMIAEILLGRRGRQSPINTMRTLAQEERTSGFWILLGWLGVLSGLLILSFYSVIAGMTAGYTVRAIGGVFTGITAEQAQTMLANLTADPERLLAWHTIFMAMVVVVAARGVRSGLEQAVKILMPTLLVLLLFLMGYAVVEGDFEAGYEFLFSVDFSAVTPSVILDAMGQAFFTLSLGMGAIMIYGSYLPDHTSIAGTSFTVAAADTLVALVAGLAIFPMVFAYGLEPNAGFGLIFETLPLAFGEMPGGVWVGTAFFLLLLFAAWTSAISLMEPIVAWLAENRGLSRIMAAATSGILIWLLGIGTLLSFNLLQDFTLFGLTIFESLDFLTANIMLPLGGLLIAIFVGWIMSRGSVEHEMDIGNSLGFRLWYFLIRFIAPLLVLLVFLSQIGIL